MFSIGILQLKVSKNCQMCQQKQNAKNIQANHPKNKMIKRSLMKIPNQIKYLPKHNLKRKKTIKLKKKKKKKTSSHGTVFPHLFPRGNSPSTARSMLRRQGRGSGASAFGAAVSWATESQASEPPQKVQVLRVFLGWFGMSFFGLVFHVWMFFVGI